MDILIENITQAVELNIKATRNKQERNKIHFVEQGMIQSCGVSFQIWKKKDSSNSLDWTSLGGTDKRKVLSKLPAHVPEILPPNISLRIAQLWKVNIADVIIIWYCICGPILLHAIQLYLS